MDSENIAAIARGIAQAEACHPDDWQHFTEQAQAALSAIKAQGLVVVRVPKCISEQSCLIGKTEAEVTIDCETADEANDLMDWLTELPVSMLAAAGDA